MNIRDFKRLKKIARERGGGETIRQNKWPEVKRGKPRKNRAKSHPKIRTGRTVLVRDNKVL